MPRWTKGKFTDEDGLRPCAKCGGRKPLSEFQCWKRLRDGPDGIQYARSCRVCSRSGNKHPRSDPAGFRTCSKCKKLKATSEFHSHARDGKIGFQGYCKVCDRERQRNYTPAQGRQILLKCKYGITLEIYEAMLKSQNGGCAICGKTDGKRLHVDHDHATGKVRGLLCFKCNVSIGHFGDDIAVLRLAIRYLESFRTPASAGVPI